MKAPHIITIDGVLPRRLFYAGARQQVVDYLVASDLGGPVKRKIYRVWCSRFGLKARHADLEALMPKRGVGIQMSLLEEPA